MSQTQNPYHICIYGDSNSWGYLDDGQGRRYAQRWPVVMQEELTTSSQRMIQLTEECLPGRTTAYPDPQEGPEYNGLPYLKPALLSHAPVDLVLIMLGTNDGKARFDASAEQIADNLITLAKIVRRAPVGVGKWREAPAPKVMLIAPARLGDKARHEKWPRYAEWIGGFDKLSALPDILEQKVAKLADENVIFADANQAASSSHLDPIHWQAEMHHKMGTFMAQQVMPII